MNRNQQPIHVSSFFSGQGAQEYPGLENYYPPGFQQMPGFPAAGNNLPAALGKAAGGANSLSSFNIKDLGSLITRMGGIDGVLATLGKVQKIVATFQQMAPMMKLLMGSFLPAKAATTTGSGGSVRRKRKRRKKRNSSRKPTTWKF